MSKAASLDSRQSKETRTSSPNNNQQIMQHKTEQRDEPEDNLEYPPFAKVITILLGCYLSMFLVALDRTIIATAIPKITDDFHSISNIGWYGSSYMLANCSLQMLYGRMYKYYSVKYVYLVAIALFEVGSAVCGAAPNSVAFIIGRAIAGAGSAGIFSGVMQILLEIVPLHKRPAFVGFFGSVFGIASAVGPLLGGAFTEDISWRWCFYINLPLGAITVAIVCILFKASPAKSQNVPFKAQISHLDPLGTLFFIPSIVCLLLALQWGNFAYPWSSPRIIVLFIVFGFTLLAFAYIQYYKGETATIPPRIFLQRSILSAFIFSFSISATILLVVYYLPIYFQAIRGSSAVQSGIQILPSILSLVTASILSGIVTQKIGYYVPAMLFTPVFISVGAGLLTTLNPSTGHAKWIAYQFLYGFGVGLGTQTASLSAQAVLPRSDVPIGIAFMFFAQQLGGAIFVSVGQNVFAQKLVKGLVESPDMQGNHNISAKQIAQIGATELRSIVPDSLLPTILDIYNKALREIWWVALGLAVLLIIPAMCMEWKDIRKGKEQSKAQGPPSEKPEDQIIDNETAKLHAGKRHQEAEKEQNKTEVENDVV